MLFKRGPECRFEERVPQLVYIIKFDVCLFVSPPALNPVLDQMSQKFPCILIRARERFLRSRIFDLSFPEPGMGITPIIAIPQKKMKLLKSGKNHV